MTTPVDVCRVAVSPNPAPLAAEVNLEVRPRFPSPTRCPPPHSPSRPSRKAPKSAFLTRPPTPPRHSQIDYACASPIPNARWVVQYTVDMTATRAVLEVGASEPLTCDAGANTFAFHADGIDFAGVKKSALDNVGVLTATLRDADGHDVHRVVCVTQVMKTPEGLTRRVISPLE